MSKQLVKRLRSYAECSVTSEHEAKYHIAYEAADTIENLLAAINECYQMLLTEPMAKTAADRAEAMLREVIARTK